MKELYLKLHKIQSEIRGLAKDKKAHNYDYVTGNKLLAALKPLMEENKLILKQEIISIENTRMDYTLVQQKWSKVDGKNISEDALKNKSEILSKVMMRFTWIDCETGQEDVNLFGSNGMNDWDKGVGSALTYGERYFLLKYFHIPTDHDDIDNPDRKGKEKKPAEASVKKKPAFTEKDIKIVKAKIIACKNVGELSLLYSSDIRIKTNKELLADMKNRKEDL
tara:strand:- start:266 stop:931 length:666 start_codon:yes stop_codon:yes gene_type:complete